MPLRVRPVQSTAAASALIFQATRLTVAHVEQHAQLAKLAIAGSARRRVRLPDWRYVLARVWMSSRTWVTAALAALSVRPARSVLGAIASPANAPVEPPRVVELASVSSRMPTIAVDAVHDALLAKLVQRASAPVAVAVLKELPCA